jgi:hypothetical protein
MNFLQDYGTTQGPLGFPLTDKQAFALETVLKALPKDEAFRYRKFIAGKGPTELLTGERSDVSWISTEDPDRTREVVLARGMNDSQFRANPIVTLNHAYWAPPVGKSLWRKFATDGQIKGIKAKTLYPARPGDWPEGKDWPADIAFSLVQADLLRGKSIGLLPTRVHVPAAAELEHYGSAQVDLIIDEWILLEYACVYLPAQGNAVVESVSKSIPPDIQRALGIDIRAEDKNNHPARPETGRPIPFTRLGTVQKAIDTALARLDMAATLHRTIEDHIDRLRGRV